jgi:protein TonB
VPPSAGALDRTLSACGASLTDEWDLRPRAAGSITWVETPRADYPEAAVMSQIGMASVRLACIVPADGRLEECRVLYEAPEGLGFGRSALAAVRNSRVALPADDLSDVGKVVQFTQRFVMPTN